jgi:signal peptide peptidase SppA
MGQQADTEEEELPYLLSIENGIGLVSISGSLTNNHSWIHELFGISTYPAIRDAVNVAASRDDVHTILLDINSGGGSVAGVADTGNLISKVNDEVKPVVAFTDGNMMSAAYWLGVSAGNVFSSNTAMVGSIGVLQVHTEQSKMLDKMGITATVLRAGKYKALMNGIEPLTDTARAEAQSQLDAAYQVFVQHVAASRNLGYDHVDSTMAQGREFFGQQAAAAGLVDGILSFEGLVSMLQSRSA